MQKDKIINRPVYERAISSMVEFGEESMLAPHIFKQRKDIEASLINYYESTEEFEKCKFIRDFFKSLEKHTKTID
jgi:hypothetical protein